MPKPETNAEIRNYSNAESQIFYSALVSGFVISFGFWHHFRVSASVSTFGISFGFRHQFRLSALVSGLGFRHQFRQYMSKAETFRHEANRFRHPSLILTNLSLAKG